MTELENGFEIISGEQHIGPATVEDLLRLEDPLTRIKQFQSWLIEKLMEDDNQLMSDIFGFGVDNIQAAVLPKVFTTESFPVRLIRRITHSASTQIETGFVAILLDHLVPKGKEKNVLPYLVVRPASLPFGEQAEQPSAARNSLGHWREAGLSSLLELGLPLDIGLWQVRDHPRFEPRVNHLLAMKPIMYLKGQSTMETAREDELLTLPGVIMKVSDVARFYVADQAYEIKYESEAV